MELKVGDRARIKTLAEMLAIRNEFFFGRNFFEKWGNYRFTIISVADGFLDKSFKINVDDDWGFFYISPSAVEKINSFDIKLDENLFKL